MAGGFQGFFSGTYWLGLALAAQKVLISNIKLNNIKQNSILLNSFKTTLILVYCFNYVAYQFISRMNRWGNRSLQEDMPNFKQIFEKHPHARDMLSLSNFLEDVIKHSSEFTQILLIHKNRHILHQLLQIAINPYHYSQKNTITIDNKITHAAIQILANLSEDFIAAVFEVQASQEDEVVQTQTQYPILTSILKIAGEGQLQATALAYLSKILTPFIYQKPAEMLNFFTEQALPLMVRYFWSSQVSELAGKLLEAETEKSFFEEEKAKFLKKLIRSIQLYQDSITLEQTMESFSQLMENLVQKHQDKYDRGKYSKLLKKILEDSDAFIFLIKHLQKYKNSHTIRTQLLNSISSYLKIHLPIAYNKSEEQEAQTQPITLSIKFASALKEYFLEHPCNEFVSDIRFQLVNYYKVIKVLLTVYPKLIEVLINHQFLVESFRIMKKESNNNILHNLQRQIIAKAINQSSEVYKIVRQQINFFDELKQTITQKNSSSSYANQIFLISEVLRLQQAESNPFQTQWKDLSQTLANKRKFYLKPIAASLTPNSYDEYHWDKIQTEPIFKNQFKAESNSKPRNPKPTNQNNDLFNMASRLDQIQGTEVLSQEEDDGFPTAQITKNSHYYDDIGLTELPLDSDKSEEGEIKRDSLEYIPQNNRGISTITISIDGFAQKTDQIQNKQKDTMKQQDDLDIPELLPEHSVRHQQQHSQLITGQKEDFDLPKLSPENTVGHQSQLINSQIDDVDVPELLPEHSVRHQKQHSQLIAGQKDDLDRPLRLPIHPEGSYENQLQLITVQKEGLDLAEIQSENTVGHQKQQSQLITSQIDDFDVPELLPEHSVRHQKNHTKLQNVQKDDLNRPLRLPIHPEGSYKNQLQLITVQKDGLDLAEISSESSVGHQKQQSQLINSQKDGLDVLQILSKQSVDFHKKKTYFQTTQNNQQTPETVNISVNNKGNPVQSISLISNTTKQQSIQPKGELRLSEFNQFTVSINIAQNQSNVVTETVPCKEQIQCLLLAKYKLALSIKKKK